MKRCRICRAEFEPRNTLQQTCKPACAIEYSRTSSKERLAKDAKRAFHVERIETSRKLRKRTEWIEIAQRAFNSFIRLRDQYLPCISCGNTRPGTKYNAGHYRPAGMNSALRFDEANVHKQCEHCNTYKSGNLEHYRPNLIAKIGLAEVTRLESMNETKRWEVPELETLIVRYRAKVKEFKRPA